MDFETIIKDTITVYQQNCGQKLTEDLAKDIIRALLSARDTERILQVSPRHLLQVVFENKEFYGKSVYPCDIVQLRRILETKRVTAPSSILLFSNAASDRIFKEQKCRLFLSLDPNKIAEKNGCEVKTYGGLAIFDSNELDITDAINCIVVEGGGYENVRVVEAISKETNIGCPVYTTSFIPGIDKYKFARTMHLFEVDIPSLGIHKEKCRSISPTQALQDVLSIRWDRHPDSKVYKRRPERYTAEYWANSGFFDSIVRHIGRRKEAAAMPQINLTPQEQTIFATLMDINTKMSLGITFRVAGGWVRDKLLGTPSDDIDIALDKMTGQQFVNKAIEYTKMVPGSPIKVDSAYVVKQNVEKSKHLETTALDIGGLKIDFVNLRDESYGDSRIPTMTLSDDPKVDALRRDLTINAMFYNVNTGQVEDYVGGLKDLQSMVLRTPLDPKKTFMDDPLRMLRVFRFYSRYPNANIDEGTLNAMRDPDVHNAYRSKVAPERAGPEIIKMFGAERPAAAIRAMFATGLDAAIFDAEETRNLLPLNMDQRNRHHKFNLLEHTLRVVENLDKLMKQRNVSKKDRINMLMAAVFHDYGKAHPEIGKPKEHDPGEYTYVGHEDKSAGSTVFSEAGILGQGSVTPMTVGTGSSLPVVRAILMAASGVILRLSSSITSSTAPASTLIATEQSSQGSLFGAVTLLDGTVAKQEFVLLLNGHKGTDPLYPNVITASFDVTSPSYFANVLNTDPYKYQQAGHYLYAHWDLHPATTVVTGSGLLNILSGSSAATAVRSGVEISAFITTGSTARNVGSATIPNYESFTDRFKSANTPWVISQRFGGTATNLFRLHALDAGAGISANYKFSIENITPSSDPANEYGNFDLVVRDWNDRDSDQIPLEQFRGLNLDPSSDRYICKVIGDANIFYDFDQVVSSQKLIIEGNYPNRSNLVRVEVSTDVENQAVDATALPFGVRGISHLMTSGTMPMTSPSHSHMDVAGVLKRTVQAPLPMRKNITQGTGAKLSANPQLYWGTQFEHVTSLTTPNAGTLKNKSLVSFAKYFPDFSLTQQNVVVGDNVGTVATAENGIIDSDRFNLNQFSLENIQVVTASSGLADPASWSSATYVRDSNITTNETAKTRRLAVTDFTQANRKFLKYTFFMQGGFNGVNIFDADEGEITNTAVVADNS
jgi:tRNA nucleotidyltransferase/poly(A) polymerase